MFGGGFGGDRDRDRGFGGDRFGGRGDELGAGLRKIDWGDQSLVKFEKNFYHEHPNVSKLSEAAVEDIREKHQIKIVAGKNVPKPIQTFEEASFPDYLHDELLKCGFVKPTPIQIQGWPVALSGRDMVGIAETGSG